MLCANYLRRTKSHIMSHEAASIVYLLPINYTLYYVSVSGEHDFQSRRSRSFLVIVIMYDDDEDDHPDHESKVRREMTTCPSVCSVIFYLFIYFFFRFFYYFHRFVIIIRRNSSRIYYIIHNINVYGQIIYFDAENSSRAAVRI